MCAGEEARESPLGISGKAILVISGPGRKMYQSLELEPEGAISPKRSKPQGWASSPHDTASSIADELRAMEHTRVAEGRVRELRLIVCSSGGALSQSPLPHANHSRRNRFTHRGSSRTLRSH